jgi:Zn-dependent M28 family amino/carboxypeptidase
MITLTNTRSRQATRVAVIGIILSACTAAPNYQSADSAGRVRTDIEYLASDAREGRGVGTAGLDSAAVYIARSFDRIGLRPGGSTDFLQRFLIDSTAPAAIHAHIGGAAVANVVAMLPGRGNLSSQTVVVGAHYDHLGYGGAGSLDPDSAGVIHNGADDNASGSAALLEIARLIASRDRPHDIRSLVFVAFTAEELGLIGSDYYVKHPIAPIDSTYAMINLDMVGHLADGHLAALGAESAEEFDALLDSVDVTHGISMSASGNGYGRSDHQSFYLEGIPVLHFFTGTHANYHRTTDDVETLDIEGTAAVASYVTDIAWTLATRNAGLTFHKAEPPPQIAAGDRPWLGTIPDMTSSPGGVRLNGVTAGSPAAEAGLQQGDVLVGLGDFEIGDLYDMTNALAAHKPGDTVTIRARRGDRIVELSTTLRTRSN